MYLFFLKKLQLNIAQTETAGPDTTPSRWSLPRVHDRTHRGGGSITAVRRDACRSVASRDGRGRRPGPDKNLALNATARAAGASARVLLDC